ncbi:hypothetical protein [Polyangium jinanense]|uniref:DUF1795 domain-containing protein n=1 Tax=Polyangium jinanense TaxID=2829994 RepID=A0A9X3X844_9BACT|nr:hypothetical protein [Polyangium jinanense]MDC3958606.1 hypothetical protein [Polyangium jinanense]MDC3983086.1 hypothetical protein [Polyangium jinanense]
MWANARPAIYAVLGLFAAACGPAKPAESPGSAAPTVAVAEAEPSGEPVGPDVTSPGDQFELSIGGKVYSVADGKPFEVQIGGERFEATIRSKQVLQYQANGISFRYPKEMTLEEERSTGVTSITVEAADSTFLMIQIYSVDVDPATLSQSLVEGIEKEMRSRGGQFHPGSGTTATRRLRGENVEGTRLEFTLAKESMRTEIYVLRKGKLTISVLIQRSDDDAIMAERRFKVITDSLR